jgi:hypothetical protein
MIFDLEWVAVAVCVFVVCGRLHSHYLDRQELRLHRDWGIVPSWEREKAAFARRPRRRVIAPRRAVITMMSFIIAGTLIATAVATAVEIFR